MVDFPAAWNMIAPKLKGERRLLILCVCLSVCVFDCVGVYAMHVPELLTSLC